jgi:hypothetical protein
MNLSELLALAKLALPDAVHDREHSSRNSVLCLCSNEDYISIQDDLRSLAKASSSTTIYWGTTRPAVPPKCFSVIHGGYHMVVVDAGFATTGVSPMPNMEYSIVRK